MAGFSVVPTEAVKFFKFSPEVCCVLSEDGRILTANPAAVRLMGYSEAQLQGGLETSMPREFISRDPAVGISELTADSSSWWPGRLWSSTNTPSTVCVCRPHGR